ncbi:Imm44 family immunity protein [Pseudoalteromonas sp. Angola-30]|uniref:Imm44 family immunity protein n=1 Tax=Pseudoalteromonas sp. Angola-30 TaxID=3025341 RepID=UPI0023590EFC|nr:Imm44 family immunity protein [Pseudoalteromonas sp. Angola-30]MDC9527838.1 Imm44 family immunity protein [Pseudoalteromonas sp. Angola-30]
MKFLLSGEIDGTKPEDQIDRKFQVASHYVSEKLTPIIEAENYGSEVAELNIIPIIVKLSDEMKAAGWHKERKLFKRKTHSTDFRLRIDYDEFCNGSDEQRIKLIIGNIIESVRILSHRANKSFDGQRLESDIQKCFSVSVT